jgi:hypothetical protein
MKQQCSTLWSLFAKHLADQQEVCKPGSKIIKQRAVACNGVGAMVIRLGAVFLFQLTV